MKLCIYAICKNEKKFVDKWLNNMSEADYIVVLDTGSTDGTYEILQADPRVTRVEQMIIDPWRFDVARNESMKLVPEDADILVCTDFDEVFNKGWADNVKEAWNKSPGINRLKYPYAWSHNNLGEPTDIFMYDKIHTKDYYWIYPIHEVLWYNSGDENDPNIKIGQVKDTNKIFLQHYEDTTKDKKYYFDLLKLSVEENPEDVHVHSLLAREYLLAKDYDTALALYTETLQMPQIDNPNRKEILLECLGRCAQIYSIKEEYNTAMWYCHEWIKEDPTYREPYFMLAEIFNTLTMYTLALAMVQTGLKFSTRKYSWIERAGIWEETPDTILSVTYWGLKDYDKAIIHSQKALKYHPTDPIQLRNYASFLECALKKTQNKLKDN